MNNQLIGYCLNDKTDSSNDNNHIIDPLISNSYKIYVICNQWFLYTLIIWIKLHFYSYFL